MLWCGEYAIRTSANRNLIQTKQHKNNWVNSSAARTKLLTQLFFLHQPNSEARAAWNLGISPAGMGHLLVP